MVGDATEAAQWPMALRLLQAMRRSLRLSAARSVQKNFQKIQKISFDEVVSIVSGVSACQKGYHWKTTLSLLRENGLESCLESSNAAIAACAGSLCLAST